MVSGLKISVIVPCYHSEYVIDDCIDSIIEMGGELLDELIVVDNSESPMDSSHLDGARNVKLSYMCTRRNLSFRAQVNMGVKQANNEFILVSNPDIVLTDRDAIPKLMEPVSQNDDVACAFTVILHPDKRLNNYHTSFAVPFLVSYA